MPIGFNWRLPKLPERLWRYTLTGGCAAVIDIVGFSWLSTTSLPPVVTATISFLASNIVNYVLTSRFVFFASLGMGRYAAFLTGSAFALAINVSLTSAAIMLTSMPSMLAKAVAVGLTFLLNFWINSKVVFQDKRCRDR
jgi:putative flippase GtrA